MPPLRRGYIFSVDCTSKKCYNSVKGGAELKITSRFTVAVHTLLAIYTFQGERKLTSDFIASSTGVNPVIVRRTLQSLKAAGLVDVKAGTGGAVPVKKASEVTLYDIYSAVDCVDGNLFNFHDSPNPDCPVGRSIHRVLDPRLQKAQEAMENELKSVTLAELRIE